MMLLNAIGVRLNILMGKDVPLPPPAFVMESFESAEIATSDTEASGFSITFAAGRSTTLAGDMPLATARAAQPGSRLVVTGILGVLPDVLIDGIIEDVDFDPGSEPGTAKLTLKGRDLTALMDKDEKQDSFPAMAPQDIVMQILAGYARHGIIPDVRPPLGAGRDNPVERTPMQHGTDLAYIQELAEQYDHIFTIIPGPLPLTSRAYWGPPPRIGGLQPAISTNMGPETNVSGLNFENNSSEAAQASGQVIEPTTGQSIPVRSILPLRPPLALSPSVLGPNVRTEILRTPAGQGPAEAMAQAQAQSDSTSDTLKVTGDLDLGKYGRFLSPRKLVGLRGAGHQHDGIFYVKDVIHKISKGSWVQSFTLTREGLGTTTPIVRP